MALDLMHADAVTRREPGGMVTTGGTGSILHACWPTASTRPREPRDHPAQLRQARDGPSRVRQGVPPARHRAAHGPVDPDHHAGRDAMADLASTTDRRDHRLGLQLRLRHHRPDRRAGELALEPGVGLHVDGCLGGFILPFGEELGYDIPPFDFRVPGVTSISADTHKYGYAFKGSSTLLFRDKALRNGQYFFLPGWTGGKYMSPGIEGSRSGGLLAATWAAMVQLGREGYRRYAEQIFATADDMKARCGRTPSCGSWAAPRSASRSRPTSSTSTTSTTSCVSGAGGSTASSTPTPSTWPSPGRRPSRAWPRRSPTTWPTRWPTPSSSTGRGAVLGAIYGGVAGGLTDEADEFIRSVMADMLDRQARPRREPGRRWGRALGRRAGPGRSASPTSSWPSTSARAARRSGSSPSRDGSPGRTTCPVAPCWLDGGRRRAGRGRVVDDHHRRRPQGPGQRRRPGRAGRGRVHHRPVGQHRPGRRRRGGRWATASCGRTTGASASPASASAGRWRATTPGRWRRGAQDRGVPGGNDPVGHMLNLATNHPEVAAAARWYLEPVDYLAMRFTGVPAATHASMTAAWLTDNRRLDLLAYDDDLVRRAGIDATKLPPLVATGSVIGPVRDDVAADLGLPAGVQVVAGVPDLHAAAVGSGALGPRRGAHGAQHHVVDQPAGPPQEDRRAARHGHHPGPRRRLPARQQPRHVGPVPAVAARQRRGPAGTTGCRGRRPPRRPTRLQLRRPHRAGRRLAARRPAHDLHPVARGRAHAGRDSHAAGRVPQPLAGHHPGRPGAGRDGGRRLQRPLAARLRREVRRSRASTPSASWAAAPSPTCGARSTPTSWTARSSGSPTPCTPSCAAPPCWRACRSATSTAPRCATSSASARRSRPTRQPAVYDRLSAELPNLYASQKKMFRRLNRRWT